MISVLLADHHSLACIGLATLLDDIDDITLLSIKVEGATLLQVCHQFAPNLLLLNPHLPGLDWPGICTALFDECPATNLIFTLEPGDEQYIHLQLILLWFQLFFR